MCACYSDVLIRLKEERTRLLWSQDDISRHMRMNQGNYCRIENGTRRLNYNEIKWLYKSGADANYIFSGQRSGSYGVFKGVCNYKEALALFGVIASVITYHWATKRTDFWKGMHQRVKFMHLWDFACADQQNIFLLVRRDLEYSQLQMAKLLEVDIKKLRDLEKGRCLPDSELLWLMYDRFDIPPAVILQEEKGLISEMSGLLEQMALTGEKTSMEIIEILQNSC